MGLELTLRVDRVNQVRSGKHRHSRSSGVEDGDKEQRPACRSPRITDTGNRVEANDDMGQSRCSRHQGKSDGNQVECIAAPPGIGGETQFFMQPIQPLQQGGPLPRGIHTETDLWNRPVRHMDGNENRRDHEGENQHAILSDLCVGNALHATQYRIHEDDGHTNHDTAGDVDFKKTTEDQTHAPHLPSNIGEGNEDGTNDCHHSGCLRVVPLTDEIRNREFSELSQVGSQQECEEDIPTGPTHQIDGPIEP